MIDEYGEGVYADLWFYYNIDLVDVVEGRGPAPFFVLSLVQRLPDDSMTAALAAGGREFFGWGTSRHLLASIYDAINVNTRATGNWRKGRAPRLRPWPRPEKKGSTLTVAEVYRRLRR